MIIECKSENIANVHESLFCTLDAEYQRYDTGCKTENASAGTEECVECTALYAKTLIGFYVNHIVLLNVECRTVEYIYVSQVKCIHLAFAIYLSE